MLSVFGSDHVFCLLFQKKKYFAYKVRFFFAKRKIILGSLPVPMVFWVGRVLDSPLKGKGGALQFVIVILVFVETIRSHDVEQ
jgi:hypothetical protein